MNKIVRERIIEVVNDVVGLYGVAEDVADHIIIEGINNVTLESLMSIKVNIKKGERFRSVTEGGAKRILAAINFHRVFQQIDPLIVKEKRKRASAAKKFLDETTTDYRNHISVQAASLRIMFEGNKPKSWAKIREKLSIKSKPFHDVIRISDIYRKSVETLLGKRINTGWSYEGDIHKLAGFKVNKVLVYRMEDNLLEKRKTESQQDQ